MLPCAHSLQSAPASSNCKRLPAGALLLGFLRALSAANPEAARGAASRALHGPSPGRLSVQAFPVHGEAGGMAGAGWAPPHLEDFILTERLGSGTYATVFKAYRKVRVAGRRVSRPGERRRSEDRVPSPRNPVPALDQN